jgi:superfamily II DNA helicase RecQ
MQIHVFAVPVLGDEEAEASLNAFLRSHRVTDVHQALTGDGTHWTYSVRVTSSQEGAVGGQPPAYKSPRIDYMKELPPDQFAIYSRLRAYRKELAEAEGVRPYTIFTNAQLATMVQGHLQSVAQLAAISGVGEARMRYAQSFLDILLAPV